MKPNVYSHFYSSSFKLNGSSLSCKYQIVSQWLFRHSESDELQDELYFPAAIFLHTHTQCARLQASRRISHGDETGQQLPASSVRRTPSGALSANHVGARKTDSLNVCLCGCADNLVCVWMTLCTQGWERAISSTDPPSPQGNRNKMSVKMRGFVAPTEHLN